MVSSYIIYKGLINYGFYDIAEELSDNMVKRLEDDIFENGFMHEYYNPENGKSNIGAGFMNWNALAGLMCR